MSNYEPDNYLTFEDEPASIEYYISNVCEFNDMLKSLLRRDPITRTAILNASYKEILTLRAKAHEGLRFLEELERRKTLTADVNEVSMIAAEQDPMTCES